MAKALEQDQQDSTTTHWLKSLAYGLFGVAALVFSILCLLSIIGAPLGILSFTFSANIIFNSIIQFIALMSLCIGFAALSLGLFWQGYKQYTLTIPQEYKMLEHIKELTLLLSKRNKEVKKRTPQPNEDKVEISNKLRHKLSLWIRNEVILLVKGSIKYIKVQQRLAAGFPGEQTSQTDKQILDSFFRALTKYNTTLAELAGPSTETRRVFYLTVIDEYINEPENIETLRTILNKGGFTHIDLMAIKEPDASDKQAIESIKLFIAHIKKHSTPALIKPEWMNQNQYKEKKRLTSVASVNYATDKLQYSNLTSSYVSNLIEKVAPLAITHLEDDDSMRMRQFAVFAGTNQSTSIEYAIREFKNKLIDYNKKSNNATFHLKSIENCLNNADYTTTLCSILSDCNFTIIDLTGIKQEDVDSVITISNFDKFKITIEDQSQLKNSTRIDIDVGIQCNIEWLNKQITGIKNSTSNENLLTYRVEFSSQVEKIIIPLLLAYEKTKPILKRLEQSEIFAGENLSESRERDVGKLLYALLEYNKILSDLSGENSPVVFYLEATDAKESHKYLKNSSYIAKLYDTLSCCGFTEIDFGSLVKAEAEQDQDVVHIIKSFNDKRKDSEVELKFTPAKWIANSIPEAINVPDIISDINGILKDLKEQEKESNNSAARFILSKTIEDRVVPLIFSQREYTQEANRKQQRKILELYEAFATSTFNDTNFYLTNIENYLNNPELFTTLCSVLYRCGFTQIDLDKIEQPKEVSAGIIAINKLVQELSQSSALLTLKLPPWAQHHEQYQQIQAELHALNANKSQARLLFLNPGLNNEKQIITKIIEPQQPELQPEIKLEWLISLTSRLFNWITEATKLKLHKPKVEADELIVARINYLLMLGVIEDELDAEESNDVAIKTTEEEIKDIFRKIALIIHPDKNNNAASESEELSGYKFSADLYIQLYGNNAFGTLKTHRDACLETYKKQLKPTEIAEITSLSNERHEEHVTRLKALVQTMQVSEKAAKELALKEGIAKEAAIRRLEETLERNRILEDELELYRAQNPAMSVVPDTTSAQVPYGALLITTAGAFVGTNNNNNAISQIQNPAVVDEEVLGLKLMGY